MGVFWIGSLLGRAKPAALEKLGCEGHYASRSQCLDELSARQVLIAIDQALARRAPVPQNEAPSASGPTKSSVTAAAGLNTSPHPQTND
jgi:hypothetical protein